MVKVKRGFFATYETTDAYLKGKLKSTAGERINNPRGLGFVRLVSQSRKITKAETVDRSNKCQRPEWPSGSHNRTIRAEFRMESTRGVVDMTSAIMVLFQTSLAGRRVVGGGGVH
jgi:hypothetical protein